MGLTVDDAMDLWRVKELRKQRLDATVQRLTRRFGDSFACFICGIDDPRCRYERHHIGGRYLNVTVILCSRCHDLASWEWHNYPPELLSEPPRTLSDQAMRLTIGHRILDNLHAHTPVS